MKCVSLFSGCGGLDLGLTQAGFRVVLAAEVDPICVTSYKANFAKAHVYHGRVEDLTPETIAEVSEGEACTEIDLLAGGPPCPPYSKSRFYRKEKPRALADPLGWATLHGYLNALRTLQPRAFLLENVAGLAYDIHRPALELIIGAARKAGYECSYKVLNAADYGVPQIRERLFLVGLRHKMFEFSPPTHRDPQAAGLFESHLPPWRTAGDAIGDIDTEEYADDTGYFAGGQYHHLLRQIPPGDNYLYFTKERSHPTPIFRWRSRYWSFLLKLSPNLPSWTIQARRSNNMGPFHWRNRILRTGEIKRLQTFPDTWCLEGSLEQQWRQVGNAVPPLLAYHLGLALARQL